MVKEFKGSIKMKRRRIIIMGAAGRDFHNFNTVFRNDPAYKVVAFTAAQIPGIANRRYPPPLSGPLYPRGIPVFPEEILSDLILTKKIDQVVFSYSDVSHESLMHKASMVLACGADFSLIGPDATMLKSRCPVVSVCAVRTGCGKSQVVRLFCDVLSRAGIKPVVVRHPMPYGNLIEQTLQRFELKEDLDRHQCTIEEREEYEHLLDHGAIVYAGIDYKRILLRAEKEARLIIWDGGNNDLPFFRPDREIVVTDPLRLGHETAWYPGEVNLRRASMVVINKVNAAAAATVRQMEENIRKVNRQAEIVRTESAVRVTDGEMMRGKRVLVIEDGPSMTHGSMPSGAGLAAAIGYGAEVVDPRDWAVGSIRDTYSEYPHIGQVLPAMGYWQKQLEELAATIENVPCDLVLTATPIDLERIIKTSKQILRVNYDISEQNGNLLEETILGMACLNKMKKGPAKQGR